MAKGITSIEYVSGLGATPASTHRPTGRVFINSAFLGKLPAVYWDFILGHEEGHIVGNNPDEIKADAYASAKFFQKYPNNPFISVDALRNVLPMTTEQQKLRVALQKQRAAMFDCTNNGNAQSCALANMPNEVSNFLEGSSCKKGEYACIQAETKRKQAEAQLEMAKQTGADAITLARLNAMVQLATIEALKYSSEQDVKQAELAAAAKKASAAAGIDYKKVALIGLVAVAAIVVLVLLNSEE